MSRENVTNPVFSAYVDASAGSGKTKLLVDRIVRILLSGAEPSKILCITFTNAAADEMNERLRLKLLSLMTITNQELHDVLLELNNSYANQLMIERARGLFAKFISDPPQIQTLHGFCAKVLQKMQIINLNENLVSDTSRIIDDEEKLDLLRESFNEVIINAVNPYIKDALNATLRRYDVGYIFELICEFWTQISSSNNMQFTGEYTTSNEASTTIQNRIYQFCDIDFSTSRRDIISKYLSSCDKNLLLETAEVLSTSDNTTSKVAGQALENLINSCDEKTFYDYANTILTADFKPRTRLPLNVDMCKKHPHIKGFLLSQQEEFRILIDKIHSISVAEFNSGFNILAWHTLEKYNQKKKNQGLFEYSDLIKNTTNIIHSSDEKMALLYSIDMSVEHILVDEAQDLSEMQWNLIKTITDEFFAGHGATTKTRTIFIVGDFKQAIFGFQGAAPWVFQEVKEYFRAKVVSAKQKWAEIQLNTCYRCPPEILQVVDKVCNSVKSSFNISDNDMIQHHSTHDCGFGIVQCHEIQNDLQLKISQKLDWHLPEREQLIVDKTEDWYIANKIAETIYKWLTDKKKIANLQRPIEPQDIMILLRKRSKLQDHLVEELKSYSIPTSNLAARIFGNSIYIYDLIAVLQFTIQPLDDMNLIALLKSHPFNYSENQIVELSSRCNSTVYDQVKHLTLIDQIIFNSKAMNLKQFFQWYLDNVYLIKNAQTKLFLNYILTYSQTVNPFKISPQNFMSWIDNLLSQKQQKLYDNQSVRITTVHSAKGLEAPLVILADPHTSDRSSPVKFAYDNDIFVLNTKNSTNNIKSLVKKMETQLKMENMRLLYVAMTRAKSELHVFGTCNSRENWYSMIKTAI